MDKYLFSEHRLEFNDSLSKINVIKESDNSVVDTYTLPAPSAPNYKGLEVKQEVDAQGKNEFVITSDVTYSGPNHYPRIHIKNLSTECIKFQKLNNTGIVIGIGDVRFSEGVRKYPLNFQVIHYNETESMIQNPFINPIVFVYDTSTNTNTLKAYFQRPATELPIEPC